MKYLRGYLVAAIFGACTWGLTQFAKTHTVLVDMIYPYVTRMAQSFLVQWSGTVEYCVWQTLLLVIGVLALASLVVMVVLKWNPIQWFGWVCAVAAVLVFLNTGIYGLNEYAGPLSEDIQLTETEYTVTELEQATEYYRQQVEALAVQVPRNVDGTVRFDELEKLAELAGDGFVTLTFDKSLPVFAGSTEPVKVLGWSKYFTGRGITGATVGITGEAAVNPRTPSVMQPYAICREMAHRMSIAIDRDAMFGAYLACMNNGDVQFRYSGALMAYYYCYEMLLAVDKATGNTAAATMDAVCSELVRRDVQRCEAFLHSDRAEATGMCDLLVSWHIQEVVLPQQRVEEEPFDPLDPSQVDLSGIVNAPETENDEENAD